MSLIDLQAMEKTPLSTDPYEHIVVPDFVRPDALASVISDFPSMPGPGSHPPSELKIQGQFAALMAEMTGPAFEKLIEQKFDIDLSGRPTMYTVRGFTRAKDGEIHTDSETKLITVLLYLNDKWTEDVGRLRLLRNGTDLENYAAEVPPYGGMLLAFKRSNHSWHGHKPFVGPRRAIQLNWVVDQSVADFEQRRHQMSTRVKKVKAFFTGNSG
ncbi:MAG: 2OG-Fe(II) oxygenase [Hyphomicrobiales bacterium]|nr:2OG-Fe(II) oxygenase [Hyphomicrobiales bacterium]MDE2113506.1 2OG-Fe(II) oxygenase [Hyphomicrobiales bacterium]